MGKGNLLGLTEQVPKQVNIVAIDVVDVPKRVNVTVWHPVWSRSRYHGVWLFGTYWLAEVTKPIVAEAVSTGKD